MASPTDNTVSTKNNGSLADIFQTTGQIGAIGGAVISATYAAFGRDYTYPCTIAVLGTITWLSIKLNQSAPKGALDSIKTEPVESWSDKLKGLIFTYIDETGEKAKLKLTASTDGLSDASIASGKSAAISYLPPGIGASVAGSLDLSSSSVKGLSKSSVGGSVNSTASLAKKSVNGLFNLASKKKI